MKKKIVIFLAFLFLFIFALFTYNKDEKKEDEQSPGLFFDMIEVQIKGEVKYFGKYYVKEDTMVKDLILLAGDVTEYAFLEKINYNQILKENDIIVIPTINNASNLISINNSNITELTKVKGIGEVKAKAIIEYRELNGDFTNIYELLNVTGITEKFLNSIIDYVKL